MKRVTYLILTIAFVLSLSTVAFAQASVFCQGTICGGAGVRLYQYDVQCQPSVTFQHFHIGTCDGNINNYGNWLMPAGWQLLGIFNASYLHEGFTPHGGLSQPTGTCPYTVAWTGPAINAGLFGYDNSNEPHDVGWDVNTNAAVVSENWAAPVGLGAGPVHAPVPEPGALLALGVGFCTVVGSIIRRR